MANQLRKTNTSTILVIDDEFAIREALMLFLSGEGYEVLEAGNGLEALDQIAKHQVDLIISDIMMPVMSGTELMAELKQRGISTPVILMTAAPLRDTYKSAAFLRKPFNINEILAHVRSILPS